MSQFQNTLIISNFQLINTIRTLTHFELNYFDTDEKSFRDLVVWLEDQKVRHYKIEDRGALKGVEEADWATAYRCYLGSLNCPVNPNERAAVLDWLLGLAVRFEYGDNGMACFASHTFEMFISQ